MSAAIATLTAEFDQAFGRLGRTPGDDRQRVVVSWPAVPIEVVRAAGFQVVVARSSPDATPVADAQLEPGLFPPRLRHLVEAALDGRLADVAGIVLPRTSDPDYKCFLYLREFVRTGVTPARAPIWLFDLLQSPGTLAGRYDEARLRALIDVLAAASGRRPPDADLRLEIEAANAARAAARRLTALRLGTPRVTGAAAYPLLGAFWQMPPAEYATLANEAADEIARRPGLDGPRVLLAGAPVEDTGLHAAVEAHGAIVVAELSPWGSAVAGDDVRVDQDPVAALAAKYRFDTIGPRVPAADLRVRLERSLVTIDAVVVSLPEHDTAFGWDYPALRDLLDARGIPHAVVHGAADGSLPPADQARLGQLMGVVGDLAQVRRG